jgi:hypothetical protein
VEVIAVIIGALLVVVLVVVVVLLVRAKAPEPAQRPDGPAPWSSDAEAGARVVLDVVVDDPSAPSVQRLVQEAASRALDASPDLQTVTVVDREETVLGEIRRVPPAHRDVELPPTLHEPHQRRSVTPDPVRSERTERTGSPGPIPARSLEPEPIDAPGAREFADQYDLPAVVEERLAHRDDPAAVIAALLAAAGRPVERHGDLVLSGDVAVVVAIVDDGGHSSLSRAFLKVQGSGAPYGLIVRIGYADPVLVHQREIAAPQVRHVPARAVQRMADAVALGQDPLAFALGPPVAH